MRTCRRIIRLVAATHPDHADAPESVRRFVRYGASPRGAQAIITAAKIRAAAAARAAVTDADVLSVVPAALRHRLILNFEGQTEAVAPDRLIEALLGGDSMTKDCDLGPVERIEKGPILGRGVQTWRSKFVTSKDS